MAPEYVLHGQFSVKLDVFSFGVLVLEIITGQHNQNFQNESNVYLLSHVSTSLFQNIKPTYDSFFFFFTFLSLIHNSIKILPIYFRHGDVGEMEHYRT